MFTDKKNIFKQILILLFLLQQYALLAQTQAQLIPKKGLHITTNKLNWLTGSEISFFTPDKKNHHYFFTWWEQDYEHIKNIEKLFIGSKNTAVNGEYTLEKNDNKFQTKFECNWSLKNNAIADIVYAKIWFPYFSNATFSSKKQQEIKDWNSFHENNLQINTSFGVFSFIASHPFKIKIIGNLLPKQSDYAVQEQYLIFYEENISIQQTNPLNRSFSIEHIETTNHLITHSKIIKSSVEKIVDVWNPSGFSSELLPQPKYIQYTNGNYLIPINKTHEETGTVKIFRKLLKQNWQIGKLYFPEITTRRNNQLSAEAYVVEVNENKINITYSSPQGLQYALQTLAQLVKNKNGELIIPTVIIKDEPSVSWRGIHMFTGPTSWQLHKRMYEKILLPIKANKIVLQCEQANWNSRPEVHNNISVPLQHLKEEFDYLKNNNVEPIPLIQSLGHMEWFFKPKQNRYMAVNPSYAYTLNPNLLQSQKAISQIWNEAVTELKPKTIHIGFDEIGMIGFNEPRENEITYFKKQINYLHSFAKKKNLQLMIWGDMGLAPSEGTDALNGITKERAATIRSFIPQNTLVGDWHYINNANPEIYKTSLRIWKQNKNIPIASTWFYQNNIKGFVQAAIDEKVGVLQTTWADFESSEKNMLLNIEQFGAYILALDYAWSGRKEMPNQLPYNATEEWINRFYAQPKPIKKRNGYRINEKISFNNITINSNSAINDTLQIMVNNKNVGGFVIEAKTNNILQTDAPVAMLLFMKDNKIVYSKQLRYGVEIRAKNDNRIIYAQKNGSKKHEFIEFIKTPFSIDKIQIINLHPASGLQFNNFILLD